VAPAAHRRPEEGRAHGTCRMVLKGATTRR
jgi:hypothetical protein